MNEIIKFRRNSQSVNVLKQKIEFAGNAFLPKVAFVPINFEGKKATPVISLGQAVEEGQILARASDRTATDIHSPIPGIILDIVPMGSIGDKELECIKISLDGKFNMLGKRQPNYGWQNSSAYELLRIIEEKGLIYTEKPFISLASKLKEAIHTDISVLQFALFDFDASCGLEKALLSSFFTEIFEGLSIISKILDCNRVQIFYDSTFPNSLKDKVNALVNTNAEVVFTKVKNTFPFYDIKNITYNKEGNTNTFILNPSTAMYVYEAIVRDRPFVSSYVLFSGNSLKEPKLLKTSFGTLIGNLIEECGGVTEQPVSLVINGLLSGYSTSNFDIPTNKTIKSVTVLSSSQIPRFNMHTCNSCGKCINTCPMHLNPQMLLRRIQTNNFDEEVLWQLSLCTKCNICSACCECRIPIANIIAKVKLMRSI